MSELFITKIRINEVRHLKDFEIPLSETERKHLILTGRNGSGKTSVLMEIGLFLRELEKEPIARIVSGYLKDHPLLGEVKGSSLPHPLQKVCVWFNQPFESFGGISKAGEVHELFLGAKRAAFYQIPDSFQLRESYDGYSNNFIQLLVDLKAEEAFSKDEQNFERVANIQAWFGRIEESLKEIFEDSELNFRFDRAERNFYVEIKGRERTNLNQFADGHSQFFGIVSSIIMKTLKSRVVNFDAQAIVLIDEIETHLHIALQKKVMRLLTKLFPRIQFIVTTHSPFVLNSVDNAVICDLEKRIVTEDLSAYSSELIVESYFDQDKYSDILKSQVAEYEQLMGNEHRTLEQEDRLLELERYLEAVPKYLSNELAAKLYEIQLKYFKPAP